MIYTTIVRYAKVTLGIENSAKNARVKGRFISTIVEILCSLRTGLNYRQMKKCGIIALLVKE
jgi:hypothetical protein